LFVIQSSAPMARTIPAFHLLRIFDHPEGFLYPDQL